MKQIIAIYILAVLCHSAMGLEKEVLSFQQWKDGQVVDAKNQVVRLTNRITLIKKGLLNPEALKSEEIAALEAEISSDRMKATKEPDLLVRSQDHLKAALENLQFTTELGLEDYFAVYLSRYKDQPEALAAAASKLSKEEVSELLKVILKEKARPESTSAAGLRPSLSKSVSDASL